MNALKKIGAGLAGAFVVLTFWPDGMAPQPWTPPPAPELAGAYAPNDALKDIQKLAQGVGVGPEGINIDAVGRIYAGYDDGRIVQMAPDGSSYIEFADTHGHPQGITFGPRGGFVIADAEKGLLHLGSRLTTLVDSSVGAEGMPFRYTNDVDNTRLDKWLYFTDSSSKFTSPVKDIVEHGANGRLLRYHFETKQTEVLMKDLHFPNGVAVGPDDAYVLVTETSEYRVLRYWLKGDKAGTHDVFIDNLPGMPDNISYNNGDRFYLALVAPRDPLLDKLLPGNALVRKWLGRLGPITELVGARKAWVLGLGLEGKVVANLQYSGSDAYAPITSVREFGPWLYFGSESFPAIGRLPLERADSRAPPPPNGWENVAPARETQKPRNRETEEEEEREREREGR